MESMQAFVPDRRSFKSERSMPDDVQNSLSRVLDHFRVMAEEDERAEAESREARLAERRAQAAEEAESRAEAEAEAEG